ncbi:MAG: hypothetical protein PHG00_09045 [Methylococcales bacterium]|nr:hypothetical protein [Methylococcales bacterium]
MSRQDSNKEQKSGSISREGQGIAIPENGLLVPLAKSKKLAALRKQSQSLQSVEKTPVTHDETISSGLKRQVKGLLKEAREQINAKVDAIMASYPPAKKNKMFTLRYGSIENIQQMNMKAIFTYLNIAKPKNFALIENLDYSGNANPSKSTRSSPVGKDETCLKSRELL